MLGMQEMLVILVIALIIFGPRKLPELGKSIGQAMAQFRRASEDFKRTWEQEVEVEKIKLDDPKSGAPAAAAASDYGSDYNYGYDSATETAANGGDNAYQTESATPEPTGTESSAPVVEPAAAAAAAKPAQQHWI